MSTREERVSLELVMKNLNKEISKIHKNTMKGLISATIPVRRDMDHVAPVIPVDTGNLRSSYFVVTSKGGNPKGKSPTFKGKNADEMASNHATVKESVSAEIHRNAVKGPIVAFGFSAEYAYKVHEMYGFHFQRTDAGAGYFVCSIYRNRKNVLDIIRENAKI